MRNEHLKNKNIVHNTKENTKTNRNVKIGKYVTNKLLYIKHLRNRNVRFCKIRKLKNGGFCNNFGRICNATLYISLVTLQQK